MSDFVQRVNETAAFIKERLNKPPMIGILTGTGLGESVESIEISMSLPYKKLPHFPVPTVESHMGRLLAGTLSDKPVLAMQGRFHLYEGYSPQDVTFPIRVMQAMGINVLILSNAAGGLNPNFNAGDIMIISDHINLTGTSPLVGPNKANWGIRFPDMIHAYDKKLASIARAAAEKTGISIKTGVYAGLMGPSLETPAETRFLRTIGADAVGFSTIQEVIAGNHAGMKILGLSTITNINNPDRPAPTTAEDVISVARETAPKLDIITKTIVANMDER